jgi:hypothetical protein
MLYYEVLPSFVFTLRFCLKSDEITNTLRENLQTLLDRKSLYTEWFRSHTRFIVSMDICFVFPHESTFQLVHITIAATTTSANTASKAAP